MLFSILIFDEPGSAALRDEYRRRHLDYLKIFDDQTLFAGPFTTDDEGEDLGSLRLIEFPDIQAAEKHVTDEPYVTGGVQKRWQIHRWRPANANTWRDCPRKKGNIQALFVGIDKPESAEIRAAGKVAHEAFMAELGNSIMCRGPLLSDDRASEIGSLYLIDIAYMAAARAVVDNDPLVKAGCFERIEFHRWRFGRVFDRYKT